ncbi:MAG: Gfo/Idh/MocA family protein [Thermomicrobiales bacterium]
MGRRYRAGIIGCSGIGLNRPEPSKLPYRSPRPHSHAAAYDAAPDVEVVAVCDVVPEATARYRALWGDVATYADAAEMFARERLDLVSIATPDHLHADLFVSACAAGMSGIFCEKPLATTLADADRMIAAAAQSGVKVVVNHTRRFDPFYRQAKWLLTEGEIGAIRCIVATLGGPRAMLFRNGTHLIDMVSFFADAPPAWVAAEFDDADAAYGPIYRGGGGRDPGLDPGANAYLRFTNGVRAFYSGMKGTAPAFELDVQGERGRIRIGDQIAEVWTLMPNGGLSMQPLPQTIAMPAGMVTAVADLIRLVEIDGDGIRALREARTTLEILLGILESASGGSQKVDFPLAVLVG